MKSQLSLLHQIRILVIILLALGIYFRFNHLDLKPYWQDETYTLLRLSGYKLSEAVTHFYTGHVITVADTYPFQQLSDRGAIATIQRLAEEVPQHPPLYFVLARYWAQWFGDSAGAVRSLSAIASLLGFPAIYWLAVELFAAPMVGWMAMGLFAVSPVYLRYAQEARPYSLWIVLILLVSAALLRAMRQPSFKHWSLYALLVALCCYCHLLSSFVLVGHGLYVLTVEQFHLKKRFKLYLLASLVGIALFIPWLAIFWVNRESAVVTSGWVSAPLPLSALITAWGLHLSQAFVSWHVRFNPVLIDLAIPIAVLVVGAIAYLIRHTPKQSWVFVVALICIPLLVLMIPDLLWEGRRSVSIRYFLSCLIGIHLAVAYLLSTQLVQSLGAKQTFWKLVTVVLLSAGVITGSFTTAASTWWGWSEYDVEIGRLINQTAEPLVISDMPIGVVLPLTHRLNPQTKLLLVEEPDLSSMSFQDGFVYNPSDRLYSNLVYQGIQPQLMYQFEDNGFVFSLYHFSRS